MQPLAPFLAPIICEPTAEVKRGRRAIGTPEDKKARDKEGKRASRAKASETKCEYIAILDMETDPFDAETRQHIAPFLAVLYSDHFEPIVIWDENPTAFITRLMSAIEGLPHAFTIYAHNGGKFDYLFLLHKLRGKVSFKGRGIMAAKIGVHELRDSFHIIPERLANYKKDHIDYENMRAGKRGKHKHQIIDYCIADCRYLLDIVKKFLSDYGMKISIGQAAMAELKKGQKVAQLGANMDAFLRHYFFGGRVECLQGKGLFDGPYKLYDVNSMYPFVMANYQHPIGNAYVARRGDIGPDTIFIELSCFSHGALVKRGENNETHAPHEYGRFRTTVWEYNVALKYGLIERVKIHHVIDCKERADFSGFVLPLYAKRMLTKKALGAMKKAGKEATPEFDDVKKDDIFLKLIMNNAYGKFAQNPRKFKEHWYCDPGGLPENDGNGDWRKTYACDDYEIYSRPSPNNRFNNVGTAASITGASRAVLLEAIQNATDPIYCDTDSLICRDLSGVRIDAEELGAWDIEKRMSCVVICGKKQYGYIEESGKENVRQKGAQNVTFNEMLRLLAGEVLAITNPAPTITKYGEQFYMTRNIRATGPEKRSLRNGRTAKSLPYRNEQGHTGNGRLARVSG